MAGGIAAAVPAALIAALAGTALHHQQVVMAGVELPLGAFAALMLLASVQLLLAAAFRSPIPTAVCGVLCYVLVGWWSAMEPGKRLIAGDLAGNAWVYGIVGVTVLMLVWARRYRRRAPGKAATADTVPVAADRPS
jgi:N-acetyl-1-D-myo-inositol-2-amino-2-deoxy-alpha-D-glucopyranoside deacetylase